MVIDCGPAIQAEVFILHDYLARLLYAVFRFLYGNFVKLYGNITRYALPSVLQICLPAESGVWQRIGPISSLA